ncbi:MAG: CCA tRNA nucleotidyltransferase [Chlamydiia bacterium]
MDLYLEGPFEVVKRLQEAGFEALYAGGCVRDFLLGRRSTDVDVATQATPDQVMQLFPKTVPVGVSFGVVIVVMEGEPIEVATFRKEEGYEDGRHPDHVTWADARMDAERRDFTVNGMFYDPIKEQLLDFVGGREDLKARLIRAIGDPAARFREDHLRLLRAVRFAVQLGFELEPSTRTAIIDLKDLLKEGVSVERIMQELQKMQARGVLLQGFQLMQELGLLQVIFPEVEKPLPPLPDDLPVILQICALHRHLGPLRWLMLPIELKLSGEERRMTETLAAFDDALRSPTLELVDWAHLLARPWADECLEALFAWGGPYTYTQREIVELMETLAEAVTRIELGTPLVSAADLAMHGVAPGPQMGHLLRKAERIAIEQELTSKEEILAQLPLRAPPAQG